MTDRIKGVWVSFEEDIREDVAEPILNAIRQIKGVAGVAPSVVDTDDWINRDRVRRELAAKLWDALK